MSRFRTRVGSQSIDSITHVFVSFLTNRFVLIDADALSTDGQLEPSFSRYRGCAFFCARCRRFLLDKSQLQQLHEQIDSGACRLQITCPFPDAVEKIRKAMNKKDFQPKVSLLELDYLPAGDRGRIDTAKVAELLGVDEHGLAPVRIRWSRLSRDCDRLLGSCPKVPSDLQAGVGYHIDNENPDKKERVFGYLQQRTTAVNVVLGLELPVAGSTYPASVSEGSVFLSHRDAVPIAWRPGQVHCLDSGHDQRDIYEGLVSHGAIPIIDYNPRRENLSPEALKERGYDHNGTPYAPCGRLCRSNGYDYTTRSRQYVCGLVCGQQEKDQCPHAIKALGYSKRMSFHHHPRLIGPVVRGSPIWHELYNLRTASERTNSYSQEVIAEGARPKLRGLKAFSFAGAMAALAQLLRRAMNFVLDVTYTQGRLYPLRI